MKMDGTIIILDDKSQDMEKFIRKHKGTEVNFREPFTLPLTTALAMSRFQWLSALMYFSGPLRQFTSLQCSVPLKPQILVATINKYKPNVTAWTPHLLGQFLQATERICNLSCFKYIAIAGSPMERPILDKLKERFNAFLHLVYSMTELLVPAFDYRDKMPFGPVGKPFKMYKYKIVDEQGHDFDKPFKTGELWIKGDAFFKKENKNYSSKVLDIGYDI